MSFQLAESLQEEMQARGWTDDDIRNRIDSEADRLAAFLAIYCNDENLILDDKTASILDRVFGMSDGFFKRVEAGFRSGPKINISEAQQ